MKESIAGITPDRRLQVLLVAFCFGAFIEGCAGFGAPVAIAGAFMIGLAFARSTPPRSTSSPTPLRWPGAPSAHRCTLSPRYLALPESDLSAMIGRILPFTAIIVPFWLVRTMVGWARRSKFSRHSRGRLLVLRSRNSCGQTIVDSNLVDIMRAPCFDSRPRSCFSRVWKPKKIWRFDYDKAEGASCCCCLPRGLSLTIWAATGQPKEFDGYARTPKKYPASVVLKSWMPFAILSVFVLLLGAAEDQTRNEPGDHALVQSRPGRTAPSARRARMGLCRTFTIKFRVTLLSFRSRLLKPHAMISTGSPPPAPLLPRSARFRPASRHEPGALMKTFWRTLVRMRLAMIAISFMLGLGFVTRYSGLDAVLGLAFTRTGWFYPFFGTFLGWLGVALTGSDTHQHALWQPAKNHFATVGD